MDLGFYFASGAVRGRVEEVRIFVPFVLALMLLTASAVASRVPRDRRSRGRSGEIQRAG